MRQMRAVCKPFFEYYDTDRNHQLSRVEFGKVLCDLRESMPLAQEDALFTLADMDKSGYIDFDEFVEVLMRYYRGETKFGNPLLHSPNSEIGAGGSSSKTRPIGDIPSILMQRDSSLSVPGENMSASGGAASDAADEEDEMPDDLKALSPAEQQRAIWWRSIYLMGGGTFAVLLFSDPAVEALDEIGNRTGIPNFYVSFILAPLASNASELVATYKYCAKKTQSSMTIGLSTLLGAACMNNTFCLGIFYFLVWHQGLSWNFTAEIFVILLVQIIVGIIALKPVQTLRDGAIIITFYPASLILVWVLNNIFNIQ